MLKRNEKLIKSKFLQYLVPSVMMTMALQLGNIVDTMIVGNILGADAMSAVKIGMTLDNIVEIPGYVLGVGGSVAAGILLGKRNREKADRVFSATLAVSVIFGVIFALLSFTSPAIAAFLTGGSSLSGDVEKFVFVTLLGAPVLSLALQFMNYVAVDNNPTIASVYVIMANVINLTLDVILLKFTSVGTAGAALSTVLGYGISLVVLIKYIKSPKRMLKFVNPFKDFASVIGLALKTGIPTLLYMIFITIKDYSINIIVVSLIGNDAMAIYTVCCNVILLSELLIGGITATLSSIGEVIYGEKDFYGIRVLCKNVLMFSYAVLSVLLIILVAFPSVTLKLFGITDSSMLLLAQTSLRIFVFCLPFYVINKFFTIFYQVTEKTALSGIITSLQNCIAVVPLAFLFIFIAKKNNPDAMLNALMFSFIASEILTFLLSHLYRMIRYRRMGILILPKGREENTLDISIKPEINEACALSHEIMEFCDGLIPRQKANLIAVAAEEMAVNIIKYGGKKSKSIDINLCITDDTVMLRTRDNGIPFDPSDYTFDSDEFEIHGIEVIKKITDNIHYLRVLDLNNTVIEIKR